MYFEHEGKQYRLGFHHQHDGQETETTAGHVMVTRYWVKHTTTAILFVKDELAIPKTLPDGKLQSYMWVKVVEARAECSRKDQFSRKLGREVALGRLGKQVSPEMRRLMGEAYVGRMKERKAAR